MYKSDYKGKFKPKNPSKYLGDKDNIIFRSLLELRVLEYFDTNSNILQYASEEFCIPYLSPIDNRIHRYFPDFWVKVREKDGKESVMVVEVKPERFTTPPKYPGRNTPRYLAEAKQFAVNYTKFEAAKQYCETRGWKFMIITEKDINNTP